jgi:hypothetical protein
MPIARRRKQFSDNIRQDPARQIPTQIATLLILKSLKFRQN